MDTEDYEDMQALVKQIYFDIKRLEKATETYMTEGERREEVATILQGIFSKSDETCNWEVNVVYDSMEEYWRLHK